MSEEIVDTIEIRCREVFYPLSKVQIDIIKDVIYTSEIEKGKETIKMLEELITLGI